jgi:hypothetical protein
MVQKRNEGTGLWLLVIAALIAYALPWLDNSGQVLSLNAYDLAEWLSKRPMVGDNYLSVLLLRGQLVLLAWALMLGCKRPYLTAQWWLMLVAGLVLVIAQLPPLTFLSNPSDVNQQQQAILSIISAIGVIVGLSGILWRWRYALWLMLAVTGLVTALIGFNAAQSVMQAFGLPAQTGIGLLLMLPVYGIATIISGWLLWRDRN